MRRILMYNRVSADGYFTSADGKLDWVVPDPEDKPWPEQTHVRQGTKVMGWVILNRVPLWYELWRRFNLFPPDYQEGPPSLLDTLLPKAGRGAK